MRRGLALPVTRGCLAEKMLFQKALKFQAQGVDGVEGPLLLSA